MASEAGYPITLVHPHKKLPRIAQDNMPASAGQFPDTVVHGVMDEAKYRAQGYLRFGEHAAAVVDHHEYPKMMRHPDYIAEVPAQVELRIENGRPAGTYTVPPVAAKMPDRIANTVKEETALIDLGYAPAGQYNKPALDAVLSATIDDETYDPDEYPKWVNGNLVYSDPNAPETIADDGSYPRFENGILVTDPRLPPIPDPNKYPMWVHVDGIPSERSELAQTPAQEHAIRMRLMPPKKIEAEPASELESEPELTLPTPARKSAKTSLLPA